MKDNKTGLFSKDELERVERDAIRLLKLGKDAVTVRVSDCGSRCVIAPAEFVRHHLPGIAEVFEDVTVEGALARLERHVNTPIRSGAYVGARVYL